MAAKVDIPLKRVVIASGQLRGIAATEVIGLEYLHDLLITLHRIHSASWVRNIRGEIIFPSVETFPVRQQAGLTTAHRGFAASTDINFWPTTL
ncbi:hypothetical protein ACFVVU_26630 [Kitasatospora sp. NPDC057965]|uniref:hypothetical protein n=1 Tax=Kitasatospora sp. NPDC057965 TaxID=3346291 RepID=UPI0036DC43A7